MSVRFYGSICITDLFEQLNKKHSAFSKAKNGKVYADVQIWLNDKEDKFGNILSAQLNPTKEYAEQDGQPYIGNWKEAKRESVSSRETNGFSIPSDIPTRERSSSDNNSDGVKTANEITEPIDDLPF